MTGLPSARITNADAATVPGTDDLVVYLTSEHGDISTHTSALVSRRVAERFCGRLMDPDPIEED